MRNLRLWFQKTGRAKYASHLDLNRCMLRALRRANIPVWYTEGFNPHPYLTFALPLPLGVESLRDVMDVRIEGEMEDAEILSRLNAVLPEGLLFTAAAEPWGKPDEICAATYEFFYAPGALDEARLQAILECGELITEKPGKQNGRRVMKQVNLAEQIRNYRIVGQTVLHLTLDAGNERNLNPILLEERLMAEGLPRTANIRRTALLTQTGVEFS